MKLISVLVLFAMAFAPAFAVPAHPRWALHWYSEKGDYYVDEPSCGALDYFSRDPKRFDYGEDLNAKQAADLKDKVETARIGEIAGFTIQQIVHNVDDGELLIKMILVERKAGEFCEIYQQQFDAAAVVVEPAYLVNVSTETVLATTDSVTGNGEFREEEYWTFDKDGPIALDVMAKINGITKKLLPRGRSIMNGSGFDIHKLSYSMPVWRESDAHCCPTGGSLHINFALKEHQLIVVSQKFAPA